MAKSVDFHKPFRIQPQGKTFDYGSRQKSARHPNVHLEYPSISSDITMIADIGMPNADVPSAHRRTSSARPFLVQPVVFLMVLTAALFRKHECHSGDPVATLRSGHELFG
jgi:hypothetical protein